MQQGREREVEEKVNVHGGVLVGEVLALHDAHQSKLVGDAIHLQEPHHRSRGLAHAIPQQNELVLVPAPWTMQASMAMSRHGMRVEPKIGGGAQNWRK